MKVTYFPKILSKESTSLILGGFESFHNGHLKLLKKAQELKIPIAIMVIANPEKLPGHDKNVYQTLDIRLQQLANLKIDYAIVVYVNTQLLSLDGKIFLEQIIKSVNAKQIIFGKNFTVGKNKHYNYKNIVKIYPKSYVIPKFKINNQFLSTSLLKEILFMGDVKLIKELCPFPYTIKVKVNANNKVNWKNNILPHAGIYLIYLVYNQIQYYGLLHISINKNVLVNIANFKIKNKSFEFEIMFIKKIRIIIKESMDKILEKDKNLILKALNDI